MLRLSLLALVSVLQLPTHAAAPDVSLDDSVLLVDPAPLARGPTNSPRPQISRLSLQSAEIATPLEFEVPLKMRQLPNLQARLARKEHISLAEMAATYHPLASDEQAVVQWLTGHGFRITHRDSSHLAVFATGTVGQIQNAFGLTFARVVSQGKEYTSAVSAPKVPDSIARVIIGINGLQPHLQYRPGVESSAALPLIPSGLSSGRQLLHTKPSSVTITGENPLIPSDIASAYNVASLYASNIKGAGQTIAIVMDTFPSSTDLTAFWKACGVTQSLSNVTFIQAVTGTVGLPSLETTLDSEWASSIAPAAKIRVYASLSLADANVDLCYAKVYSDITSHPEYNIHQMSMSYGGPENQQTASHLNTDSQYFANLTAAGVTVLASAGDQGANPGPSFGGKSGNIAESPASDPSVTAVGGTALALDANGTPTSEVAWNDGNIYKNGVYWATGGGVSGHFARPSWQTGTGVTTGTKRLVPDVSAAAALTTPAYVIWNGVETRVGGTSWSCPVWAGFCALLDQDRANESLTPLGLLGPYVYPLIGTSAFRDITSGNNGTYNATGYTAGAGYDLCTGIGVPNMANLAQTLSGAALAPIITSDSDATGAMNTPFSYQILAAGSPTSYSLTGNLPPGLTFHTSTGLISGKPTQAGTFALSMGAIQGSLKATATLHLVIQTNGSFLFIANAPNSGSNSIGEYINTGDIVNTSLISGLPATNSIAVSGSNIFLVNFFGNSIDEYTTSGTLVKSGLITGEGYVYAIAISGSNLYIANESYGRIDKYTLTGTPVKIGLVTGLDEPVGLAVSGSNMYVVDLGDNTVDQYTTSGTKVRVPLLNSFAEPWGIAVDSGYIYVTDRVEGTVGKYTTGGATVKSNLLSGFEDPFALAVSGTNIFVTDDYTNTVGQYSTSGATIDFALISGLNAPLGITLGSSTGGVSNQTITFGKISNQTMANYLLNLEATASSGLPVSYTVTSGPATISGNQVTLTGPGSVKISATQFGNAYFNAASVVLQSFTVSKGAQSISFPSVPPQKFVQPYKIALMATSSSGGPVTYQVTSGPGMISGNMLTVQGPRNISVKASQSGGSNFNPAPSSTIQIIVTQ